MQGTTLPLIGMGTPVGTVSPVELTRTKEEVSTPGVNVFSFCLFTGMTVRASGISCTFSFADTTFGLPAEIILGTATLSGCMALPVAGTGMPVFIGLPNEFTMG